MSQQNLFRKPLSVVFNLSSARSGYNIYFFQCRAVRSNCILVSQYYCLENFFLTDSHLFYFSQFSFQIISLVSQFISQFLSVIALSLSQKSSFSLSFSFSIPVFACQQLSVLKKQHQHQNKVLVGADTKRKEHMLCSRLEFFNPPKDRPPLHACHMNEKCYAYAWKNSFSNIINSEEWLCLSYGCCCWMKMALGLKLSRYYYDDAIENQASSRFLILDCIPFCLHIRA
jgi:hypothetical protein